MSASIWAPNGFSPEVVPLTFFEFVGGVGQTTFSIAPFTSLHDTQVKVFIGGEIVASTRWASAGTNIVITPGTVGGEFVRIDVYAASPTADQELPTQTGNAGKFLSTDGTTVAWTAIPEELPTQSGQAGKVLSTDGLVPSWITPSTSGVTAADVSFTLNSTGAIATNLALRGRAIVHFVEDFGADPTGVVDATAQLQAALAATRSTGSPANKGKVLFVGPGVFKLTSQLALGSNQTVVFSASTILDFSSATAVQFPETAVAFACSNQSRVYLYGNGCTINGNRAVLSAAGVVAEGGQAALYFYGTDNYLAQDFTINNFWTDGITITGDNTGSGPCTGGRIHNVNVNSCRRNGISVISAIGLEIDGGYFTDNYGNPSGPAAAIDVEPNLDCFISAVTIRNIRTTRNIGASIQITPWALSQAGAASKLFQLTVQDCYSYADGSFDTINSAGILFAGPGNVVGAVKMQGQILISNCVVESALGMGVAWFGWPANYMPHSTLESVSVVNPCGGGASSTTASRDAGFVFDFQATQTSSQAMGNVTLNNCRAEDTRASQKMTFGFVVDTAAAKTVKDVRFVNCRSTNYLSTIKAHVHFPAASKLNFNVQDCTVWYDAGNILDTPGSTNISAMPGMRLRSTANGNV